MVEPFERVQVEHHAVTFGQGGHQGEQFLFAEGLHGRCAHRPLRRAIQPELFHLEGSFAIMVDRSMHHYPPDPAFQGSLHAEIPELLIDLDEAFLQHILRLQFVARITKAYPVHAPRMCAVQLLLAAAIAAQAALDQLPFTHNSRSKGLQSRRRLPLKERCLGGRRKVRQAWIDPQSRQTTGDKRL